MHRQFYRPEIDGLRALAVIPVVLYHLGISAFSGGFVGVDVFFVVSGYLITQIIMRHIDEDGFSIALFYERRARRIAPALVVVLLFCSVTAILLLLPEDLIHYSDSLVATVLFSSNFLFWSETGYFAADAEFKPLLHTWSLAVEEQFYIIYPLLMLLILRYWRRMLVPLFWLCFTLSFALSAWGAVNMPRAAFYLAPTRAWELLMGALLALGAVPQASHPPLRRALGTLGVALIGYAVFAYTDHTHFPGLAAMAPCLGAALVIYACRGDDRGVGHLLSRKPIVGLGLISYSLYLWHWPLIVFAKYYLARPLQPPEIAELLVFSLVLAAVSWRWVEQPFRRAGGVFSRRGMFRVTALAGITLVALGASLRTHDGLSGRFREDDLTLLKQAQHRSAIRRRCFNLVPEKVIAGDLCILGQQTGGGPSFLLWGDSHANALVPSMERAARQAGRWGYYANWAICPPLLGIDNVWKPPDFGCREFNDAMAQVVRNLGIGTVVLAAAWSVYPNGRIQEAASGLDNVESSRVAFEIGLRRTLEYLTDGKREIWIVEQVPAAGYDVPRALALNQRIGIDVTEIEPSFAAHQHEQAFVHRVFVQAASNSHVHLIDPAGKLCNRTRCRVVAEGKSLYKDGAHLSEFGARWIVDLFAPVFEEKP